MNGATVSRRSSAPAIEISVRWKILGMLSLLGFLSYVFRSNLSVVLPVLRTELELTDADLALVSSAFVWTFGRCRLVGLSSESYVAVEVGNE